MNDDETDEAGRKTYAPYQLARVLEERFRQGPERTEATASYAVALAVMHVVEQLQDLREIMTTLENCAVAASGPPPSEEDARPVATIHVDGSFCHVEWHRPAPNEIHLDVFKRP